VEAAERADEVGLPREEASELDGALHRVGAVVDEEGVLQVAGRDLPEKLRERSPQGVQQFLAREGHARELVGDRPNDLRVANAGAVDAVPAEAVDVRPARKVPERRALADPLEGGVVPHLDDGLAILEVSAVVVEVEVIDRIGLDLSFCSGRQSGADDVEPALGFPDQLLPVHVRHSSSEKRPREPLGNGG
jgi:hypothetical protein